MPNGLDLGLLIVGVAAIVGLYRWARRMEANESTLERMARQIGEEERRRRDLECLVDVTPRGTLVSPRGVELPNHAAWSHLDVLATLADVESL